MTIRQALRNLLSIDTEPDPNSFDVPMTERSDYPTNSNGVPMVPPKDVFAVFPDEAAWGHKIEFEGEFANDDRRVHGWITPFVNEGDIFAYESSTGNLMAFRLINVHHCDDPADMFFADALDIGYVDKNAGMGNLGANTRFTSDSPIC